MDIELLFLGVMLLVVIMIGGFCCKKYSQTSSRENYDFLQMDPETGNLSISTSADLGTSSTVTENGLDALKTIGPLVVDGYEGLRVRQSIRLGKDCGYETDGDGSADDDDVVDGDCNGWTNLAYSDPDGRIYLNPGGSSSTIIGNADGTITINGALEINGNITGGINNTGALNNTGIINSTKSGDAIVASHENGKICIGDKCLNKTEFDTLSEIASTTFDKFGNTVKNPAFHDTWEVSVSGDGVGAGSDGPFQQITCDTGEYLVGVQASQAGNNQVILKGKCYSFGSA